MFYTFFFRLIRESQHLGRELSGFEVIILFSFGNYFIPAYYLGLYYSQVQLVSFFDNFISYTLFIKDNLYFHFFLNFNRSSRGRHHFVHDMMNGLF